MDRELAFARIRVQDAIRNCHDCELRKQCRLPVPFRGPTPAEVAVVGQGPGREEDRDNMPFVGRSGQAFEEMMLEAGINSKEIFWCNSTNCFPKERHPPTPTHEEIAACRHHLLAQLDLARPQFIIAAGGKALSTMMSSARISDEHGKPFWKQMRYQEKGVCVIPVWHPAAYLHAETKSAKERIRGEIIEDLKCLVDIMRINDAFKSGVADGWTNVCTRCSSGEVAIFDEVGRPWCIECAPEDLKAERDKRLAEIEAMGQA